MTKFKMTKEIITKDFHDLNKMLFSNELVLDFEIKITNSKKFLGSVHSTNYLFQNYSKVNSLTMSSYYELTRKQYLDVLAHEMIHVKQTQHSLLKGKGGHGNSFKKEMKRINDNFNFNITIFADKKVQASEETKNKRKGKNLVLSIGEYHVSFSAKGKIEDNKETIKLFKRGVRLLSSKFTKEEVSNAKISLLDSRNTMAIPTRRKQVILSKMSEDEELPKQVKIHGKLLSSF